MEECGGLASTEDFFMCEKSLLHALNYNALVSCPAEFLKVLLKVANPLTDFSEIISRAHKYIFECMLGKPIHIYSIDANLIGVRCSSIAISSLLIVLE